MKKIISLFIAIVIGFVIGLGVASYIAYKNIQKITAIYKKNIEIIKALPTPLKSGFLRTEENLSELREGMTKAEIKKTTEDMREWNKKNFVELNIQALSQVMIAISIEAAMNVDDEEKVDNIIYKTKQNFLRQYDNNDYKGDWNEKLADTIAQRIKENKIYY